MDEEIRSLQNPRIKAVVQLLRDVSARRESGQTVVEGAREVERAMENGWTPLEVYVDDSQTDVEAHVRPLAACDRVRVFRCSPAAFRKMSYRENPDGVLAVGPAPGVRIETLVLPPNPLVLVIEEVEKPGNIGALLRTADGAGVDAVIVCDPSADLGNPNLIRASIGTVFYLPVARASSEEAARWLSERGIRVVTTEPAARLAHTEADLVGPIAIVVGAEDTGVSVTWQRAAGVRIGIPMLGRNDSLNVSVAAAIVLYEAVRQRSAA
jgi:TrmH family RNA methyltransferase